MIQEIPQNLKRNAIIGVFMLVPFFVVIASNVLTNDHLASSTSLNRVFFFLIFALPLVAFLLNAAALLKWASKSRSFWKSLFDFKRNWVTIVVAGLALLIAAFVPLHDSVHCLTGNPIKELHNPRQTLQCIKNG